jgi:hypothetical protein
MIDAPDWLVYGFDLLMFLVIIFGILFLKAWFDARNVKGKMLIDLREPTGFTDRHLVKPDTNGQTVTYEKGTYMLTKPATEKTKENYPRIRFAKYPKNPFMGLSMFQHTLRLEEYQRNNPEPIHPFYGRVDEKGFFIDNQLTVTAIEWNAQKSEMEALGIAMSVQEREAREKEWQRAMANLPNKMIVYLGIGIAAICSAICAILIAQL